jgi:hypothetical protein
MKKLVLVLSSAVAVLGASTAWLALQLDAARTELAAARFQPGPPAAASPAIRPVAAMSAATPASRIAGAPLPRNVPSSPDPGRVDRARSFLAKYHDPVGREQLYQEYLRRAQAQYPDVGQMLNLKPEDATQLVELLVQQELAAEEWGSNCDLDLSCKVADGVQELNDTQQREIAERFGADTAAELLLYQTSDMQRRLITDMRGRLPDGARLSDAKTRELMHALAEESRSIEVDIENAGNVVWKSNYGAYIPAQGDLSGKHDGEAAEYNRRMHERAAAVLSAEQLKYYDQLIDSAIEMSHSYRPFS